MSNLLKSYITEISFNRFKFFDTDTLEFKENYSNYTIDFPHHLFINNSNVKALILEKEKQVSLSKKIAKNLNQQVENNVDKQVKGKVASQIEGERLQSELHFKALKRIIK